jgi:hypothetical protein
MVSIRRRNQILLYDRIVDQIDIVGFDNNGKSNLDTVNFGVRTTWTDLGVL